ncbi:hypothetical protein J421_5123 (plasmid) [Gemmatirosa kalamazoonensis]|uniref:Adhesin domain-containing protein n=1 Tax=Gemmatirosa kalamazoonensis TaxID=861299 RepID=W0RSV1_9BACT|nr:hypothetical protein [Gemmatirosa kalamazoonensis]AHG92658.1 hypothetical protein J421_5123 [Gemmatirosa kalamazoonensis]
MRVLVTLATATTLLVGALPAAAQRFSRDRDVEGSETCREIWREYGRMMSGRPAAVYCEVRDLGTRAARGTLDVDGGERQGVLVRGGSRSDVRTSLVIQAQGRSVDDARELARRVAVDLSRTPLRITGITAMDEQDDDHFVGATLVLDTPRESDLSLRVGYAPLTVRDVRGRMDLRADHGPLQISNVGGDVRARVEYGPLSVDLDSPRWNGTRLDAESAYGPVTLTVPRSFAGDLEIGSEHGPFSSDLPLSVTHLDDSPVRTRLGGGGPPVHAVARYGPMSLRTRDR